MKMPSEQELADAIADAARSALSDLFRDHPGRFYYCSLTTTGEGHAPCITAWSEEQLDIASAQEPERRSELKWSYGESPYYCFGEHYFADVRRLFDARPEPNFHDITHWNEEVALRLRAMTTAMSRLDAEGIFGIGKDRHKIFINAEVMPPDRTNVDRARILNPPEAMAEWMREAAELPLE